MALVTGPTALYRFFDADDHLLYVGITSDIPGRAAAHLRKTWATRAARMEIERYASRSAALKAEGRAIRDESPEVNQSKGCGVACSQDRRRLRAVAKRRDHAAADLARLVVELRDKGASLREIAEELGMSHGGVAFIEAKARKEHA